MPEQLPTIEATITVANVKDVAYTRQDGTQAAFKSLGHKNPDGSWLNLSCFDELYFPMLYKGSVLKVAYTEKWATLPNGQPKLDKAGQQIIYRTIVFAESVGGAPAGAVTSPQQNGSTPAPATKAPYNPELGAYQTALNCATTLHAALIEAKVEKKLTVADLLATADQLHHYLTTGKTDLATAVSAVTEGLDATPDDIDPNYEAARAEQSSFDDDPPF